MNYEDHQHVERSGKLDQLTSTYFILFFSLLRKNSHLLYIIDFTNGIFASGLEMLRASHLLSPFQTFVHLLLTSDISLNFAFTRGVEGKDQDD